VQLLASSSTSGSKCNRSHHRRRVDRSAIARIIVDEWIELHHLFAFPPPSIQSCAIAFLPSINRSPPIFRSQPTSTSPSIRRCAIARIVVAKWTYLLHIIVLARTAIFFTVKSISQTYQSTSPSPTIQNCAIVDSTAPRNRTRSPSGSN
jgi:hypothetical protein